MGPDADTAAIIRPEGASTGADTDATPDSRSDTDCAQPRRRTVANVARVKEAPSNALSNRSGSSQASSTCAPDPAFIESCAPTGTVSRRPEGRSTDATQIRTSPCRRKS